MFIKYWVEIFTLVTFYDFEFHVVQDITLDFAIFAISGSSREADAWVFSDGIQKILGLSKDKIITFIQDDHVTVLFEWRT